MKNSTNLPELLAPAGTLSTALAAYAAGADAVYCGVGRFNAREMGTNFSYDDLSRLSQKAKTLGKRFYLTLNTLVKETEWEAFDETVQKIARLDPDAVILQDIGVARFLRTRYPQLELHASTQMGIHNSPGILEAARMGISRVILERQITLRELKRIVPASPLDIEVFIHGALCCSLSGNCLFSSWMGGWSGNRGRCKQPCRRRFHGTEEGRPKSGFFFSTQDLYTLDMIDDLQQAGVKSLKIEGRLKQPDYVFKVVQAYRMVLDAPSGSRGQVLGEARKILSSSYGRRWSHGFAAEKDMAELVQYDSLGVSGQLVGTVASAGKGGFALKVSRRLRLGDRLRIQPSSGDEGPSFTVTAMRDGKHPVSTATEGREVFIPYDREVPAAGRVYRVGSSVKGVNFDGAGLPLYQPVRRFDLEIHLSRRGIRVSADGRTWESAEEFDEALRHPLDREKVEEEFRRSRNPGIGAALCRVFVEGNPFVPAARLKQLRRDFWSWFERDLSPEPEGDGPSAYIQRSSGKTGSFTEQELLPVIMKQGGKAAETGVQGAVFAQPINGAPWFPEHEYVLPGFCSEEDLDMLKQQLGSALEAGCRRFRISSLYQLSLLEKLTSESLLLTAAYPLPVANALAAEELYQRGVRRIQAWLELERPAIEALRDASPAAVELYRYGRPPLLITRARIPVSGPISDSRGGQFRVSEANEAGLTVLYPAQAMEVPAVPGTADCFDYLNAEPGESSTTSFNFDRELV
ncbi:U32 family peptidase [Marispirochaeta aestuarii]|uniref:peptidase U32 family protein n=1 Tax=Marispirochaeta aestuarii TaxID=1963862 RepID=UPI0029C8F274|nr:U32 family peptidase [Marispirochaeta aestuarii]